MAALKIRRCGYALGAEVTGVDASKPLDSDTIAALRRACLDHIVIYLPAQNLNAGQLRDFTAQFGEVDTDNTRGLDGLPDRERTILPEVIVRSNHALTVDGYQAAKSPPSDKWHTDFSHSLRPATLSLLVGKELPTVGGDTLFTNLYMAYETLSPAFQRMIDPMECVHDFAYGATVSSPKLELAKTARPPVVHPLVRVHPDTGRKALFIAERVRHFVGMTEEESQPLIDYLMQHATRYEFNYRHRWTVHDLIMWDNRCSLHNAVQDYDLGQLRMLLRTSLIGPVTGHLYKAGAGEASAPAAVAT
jgi:taurine dioxygenase